MQNTECSGEYLSIGQSALDIVSLDITDRAVDAAIVLEHINQGLVRHHGFTFMSVCTTGGEIKCPGRSAALPHPSANCNRRITAAIRRAVPKFDHPQGRDVMTRHSVSAPCERMCEKSTNGKRA